MPRRVLSLVSAGLWLGVGGAAFVALLNPRLLGTDDPAFAIWVAVVVLPPIAVGAGCLLLRGIGMAAVGAAAAIVALIHLFLLAFGSGSTTELIWGYLVLAAISVGLVWAIWGWIDGLRHPKPLPQTLDDVAALETAHASGAVSDAMYPFELAKLHLAQTGRRRIFVCGRCGHEISLTWRRCNRCEAAFDDFPPVATGKERGRELPIPRWLLGPW